MEEKNEKRGRKMKDLLQNAPNNGEGTEEYISQGFAYEHGLDVEENYIEAAKFISRQLIREAEKVIYGLHICMNLEKA